MEYIVKTPIKYKRERYEEGEKIELSEKEAKPLLASGAIAMPSGERKAEKK